MKKITKKAVKKTAEKSAPTKPTSSAKITFQPATPDKWNDIEALFGERGACGGCWCMVWRKTNAEYTKTKPANKKDFKKLTTSGAPVGVLAYDNKTPIAWCSVAPREQFVRLETSRIYEPIDNQPVWSITCLFILSPYRNQGLSSKLIAAAADYAKKQGAKIVEAYPFDYNTKQPPPFIWTGIASAFVKAGFKEAARRSPIRPIMRKSLR
jgi:GNAT superfamily N-acetyltransferase